MAASSTSTLSNSLKRVYSESYFGAFQDEYTPILTELEEATDVVPLGSGWYTELVMYTPQTWKTGAEGQAVSAFGQRSSAQGVVNAIEWVNGIQITEMMKNAGKGAGAFGTELNRSMEECVGDLTKGMQIMYTISHGTGRLAIVQATTSGVTQFIAKLPEGVVALRAGMEIDEYTQDTGGTVTANAGIKIVDVDPITRTVTLSAVASMTQDYHLFKKGSYGYAPNGLRGSVDNAAYAANHMGLARSSYPKLNSQVLDIYSGTTPVDLTEEHMRRVCDLIYRAGGYTDRIMCNLGGMNAFLTITDGDRRYVMDRGKTAQRVLGYKSDDLLFSYHDGNMPFKLNTNIPAREMFFLSWKKSFRKHTLRKLGWLEDDGGVMHLTPGSGSLATSSIGIVCAQQNISCVSPCWNGVIRGFKDGSIAGD